MTTIEERREVARRLREYSGGRKAFHLGRLCAACGIDKSRLTSRTTDADAEAWARLADLIEPNQDKIGTCPENVLKASGIDRDALLEEAKELEKCAWYFGLDFDADEPLRDRLKEASEDFAGCARRIREAVGA